MRHLKTVRRLNRNRSHRRALLKNLANSLFYHESIKTTNPKAMELRKVADRLITLAKRKDNHAMRLAFAFLRDKDVVKKLFTDIGDRYTAINGGYTRVLKIGRRKGDAAPMAIIELTQKKEKEKEKKVKTPKATKKPKVAKETKETKETKKAKKEKAPKEAKAPKEPKEKKEKKVNK
jgi:large subunit ribosomal protein L17